MEVHIHPQKRGYTIAVTVVVVVVVVVVVASPCWLGFVSQLYFTFPETELK